MLKQVKFIKEDSGNFRTYYRDMKTRRLLYCTMPPTMLTLPQWEKAGRPLAWYICSRDGEPCHESPHTFETVN